MPAISLLLIGFSIVSALILIVSHFNANNYPEHLQARYMGIILVMVLAGIQAIHFCYLEFDSPIVHNGLYQILLFAVAPSFYLFSKPLLKGTSDFRAAETVHLIPVVIAPWIAATVALPLSFAVGSGYLMWLIRSLYALREQRNRFQLELTMLVLTFVVAIAVLIMGLTLPILNEKLFFYLYSSAIGCAFILINLSINLFPKLPIMVAESASETYATTTLANVDCEGQIEQLDNLMNQDATYKDPTLDLSTLADQLGLSSHQLSELINTRLGISFSRYIREQRVSAAKAMLLEESSASVLSIGLSVGFTSQSNFYDAFREITGMTPGNFRKINT